MAENINIALASDALYFTHARVMLYSLFQNNPNNRFTIYLFTEVESHPELNKISRIIQEFDGLLHVVQVNKKIFEKFYVSGHVSIATYYRLIIPDLLPKEVKKILYLDTDIIVKKDIGELWKIALGNNCLAAVDEKIEEHVIRLKLPGIDAYFNAGVLLINTEVWKALDVTKKGLEIASKYQEKLLLFDQDVLNILLPGKWLPLDPKWNQMEGEPLGYLEDEPTIIHYVGKKPWTIHATHPYKMEYYRYYYKMEGFGTLLADLFKKIERVIKNRISLSR